MFSVRVRVGCFALPGTSRSNLVVGCFFFPQAMSSLAEEFPDMPAGVEYKPSSSDVMCTTLANGMKVRVICLF
jgi:hypothetical protein